MVSKFSSTWPSFWSGLGVGEESEAAGADAHHDEVAVAAAVLDGGAEGLVEADGGCHVCDVDHGLQAQCSVGLRLVGHGGLLVQVVLQDTGDEIGQRQLRIDCVVLDPAHQPGVEVDVELLLGRRHIFIVSASGLGR